MAQQLMIGLETLASHKMKRLSFVPLKEVPYEMTFLLKDATQDPAIKNRYWFDLPITWLDAEVKDPIIGIRSLYTTKTNRFIWYEYHIELITLNSYDLEEEDQVCVDAYHGEIQHWLDGSDTLRTVTDYFNQHWIDCGERWEGGITQRLGENLDDYHVWEQGEVFCHYEYKNNVNTDIRQKYYNRLCLVFGRGFLSDVVEVVDEHDIPIKCVYRISIMPVNWDTVAVFGLDNTDTIFEWTNVILPTWSRYQCFVKSSLTDMDKNNILGHTRNDPYMPIKYFRYNINVRKFWIELYETRYPDCPVIIPKDTVNTNHADDDIIVEAIVCLSSDGML